MPQITDSHTRYTNESDVTAVATPITLSDIDGFKTHCLAGLEFYSDSGGTTVVTPSAGTVVITVKTRNSDYFEAAPNNTIDATAP